MSAWLTGALLILTTIWLATEYKIYNEEVQARELVQRQSESLANSYAAQLQHVAEQIDQISLHIMHAWQDAQGMVNLQRDHERGIFPKNHGFFIFILDVNGNPVKTSFTPLGKINFSDNNFFTEHRDHCCLGLTISQLEYGPLLRRNVIRFARRAENKDGSFRGVVVISVEPDFLTTFQDETLQGIDDFVSARLDNGPVLATKLGSGTSEKHIFYKQNPLFKERRGSVRESSEKFKDGKARYIAWRKLNDYPLMAVAGLTEERALLPHRVLAHSYRVTSAVASILLLTLALAGIIFLQKLAVRRLAEENVRKTYRMATDAANEGFYMLRPLHDAEGALVDFQVEDCNERAAALIGMSRGQLVGSRASISMALDLRSDFLTICQRALDYGVYEDEFRVPAGGWLKAIWVYRRASYSGSGVALTLRDISEIKAHERALADLANNDSLTKLPNRRWLMNFLPAAILRAERSHGRMALLFIDLDNFKMINDTLGHPAGDELLVQAAGLIRAMVRASDPVARLGGDEFTVVLEQVGDNSRIASIADNIIKALSQPFTLSVGAGQLVSASIGISLYPDHGADIETLIKHADVAMYAAKSAGRARYHFYTHDLSDALMLRMNKERAIRHAIECDEFVVYYQPRVEAQTGKLCSLEALLRWKNPERGLVSPEDFIDLAEDTGLIVQIGEIVLRKVGKQIAQWRLQGMRVIPVSVNISPYQLKFGSTAACLAEVLQINDIEPHLLEVEITESAVVDNSMIVSRELDGIRALGVRLIIDDFGTGYSSLAQLHRLDVDTLKVDKEFTKELSQGSEGELLYRAIISMAAALKMQVVAEGVETLDQLRLLQTMGCDEIQGYIISRALPPEEMALLATNINLPPFDKVGRLVSV